MKKILVLSLSTTITLFCTAQLKLVDNIVAALKCKDLSCLQNTLIDKNFKISRCDTTTSFTNDVEIRCSYNAIRYRLKTAGFSPKIEVRFTSSATTLQIYISTNNLGRYHGFLNQFDKLKEKHTKEMSTINPDNSTDTDYKFPNNKKLSIHCNANGSDEKFSINIFSLK